MKASEYKEMAIKIRAELESLEIQQEEIEQRIARLTQALIGLVPLSEPPANSLIAGEVRAFLEATTFTDAARQILQAAEKPLTPIEIKQQLIKMGKDLSGQKNIMASIHSLVKRLLENDELETRDHGLTYQWKGIRRFPRLKKETWISRAKRQTTDLSDPNHPLVKAGIRPQEKKQ